MEVTRGCSISSKTLVGNSSNAGVKTRVISSNIISGSMEAEGSKSLGLSCSTVVQRWGGGQSYQQQQHHQRQYGGRGQQQPQPQQQHFDGQLQQRGGGGQGYQYPRQYGGTGQHQQQHQRHYEEWCTGAAGITDRVWYQPESPPPEGASMYGSYMCARCGARGHWDVICRAPNSMCDDFIFHGRMARQCVTAQPTVVYAPNYYSAPQAGSPALQQPRVEPTEVGDELLDRCGVELPTRASTGRAR